jgi:hypothetical protein
MADAHPVHVERLGDDDVIHARRGKPAALGEIMHAAVTAGFFVHGAGNLQCARPFFARVDERLDRNDRSGKATLHVTGAATEHLAVLDNAGERFEGPAGACLHHVYVAVEMHARTRSAALAARNHVDARIAVVVARRAFGPHILDGEAARRESLADELGTRPVGLAGRVDGWKTNQLPRQLDQLVAPFVDRSEQDVRDVATHDGRRPRGGCG